MATAMATATVRGRVSDALSEGGGARLGLGLRFELVIGAGEQRTLALTLGTMLTRVRVSALGFRIGASGPGTEGLRVRSTDWAMAMARVRIAAI